MLARSSSSDTSRGSHLISATPPILPSYLLPSFRFPFLRRRSSPPSSSPPSSSEAKSAGRLARLGPDTLRCSFCSADLAFSSQIISKGFTGRYGRAFLVAPPPSVSRSSSPDSTVDDGEEAGSLLNIRIGRLESRQLVTGWHVVADIFCNSCSKKLGWKYVDAKDASQKYKVGKFILETERVMTFRSWGDDGDGHQDDGTAGGGGGLCGGANHSSSRSSSDGISFDSDDSDECEELFAGTWDAREVAHRRDAASAARMQSRGG